jgi:hypothetical protein
MSRDANWRHGVVLLVAAVGEKDVGDHRPTRACAFLTISPDDISSGE